MTLHTATVVQAAGRRPHHETHHAGADPAAERQARQMRMRPEHWELRIRGEQTLLDYMRGAPTQRATALGVSIERQVIMGGTSRMCSRCKGRGILRPRRHEHGRTRELLDVLELQPNEVVEPACYPAELIGAPKTRDELPTRDYALVKQMADDAGCAMVDVLKRFEPWCPTCRGNGHIGRPKPMSGNVTAHPTGSSKEPWHEYDDRVGELVKFGTASSIMREVAAQDALFEVVLVAYFGTTGARWAGSVFGKVFACYPFTRAGQKLLDRTQNRAGELDHWDRIWEMANAPNRKRDVASLLDAAGTQAVALLERAGAAWDRVAVASVGKSGRGDEARSR